MTMHRVVSVLTIELSFDVTPGELGYTSCPTIPECVALDASNAAQGRELLAGLIRAGGVTADLVGWEVDSVDGQVVEWSRCHACGVFIEADEAECWDDDGPLCIGCCPVQRGEV